MKLLHCVVIVITLFRMSVCTNRFLGRLREVTHIASRVTDRHMPRSSGPTSAAETAVSDRGEAQLIGGCLRV
jgi:hypothetical protein